jgi:predicted nucleic acid-binding protein
MDTTIPSYYYDSREETDFLIRTTRSWFRTEAAKYDIVTSEATLVEASEGEYASRSKIIGLITKWRALPHDPILEEIVQTYIDNHVMPAEFGGDALHLAYASYYKIDFLMTWNCNHLANANKREHIRVINGRLGIYVPEIVTPLELISE